MNTSNILTTDVLDIIFDNRNKLYGAYPLRKYYPDRVKTALAAMFALVSVFSVLSLLPSQKKVTDVLTVMDGPTMAELPPPEKQEVKQEKRSAIKNNNTQKFTNTFITVKENEKPDSLTDITKRTIGGVTNIFAGGGEPGDGPLDDGDAGTGTGDRGIKKESQAFDPETVIERPDVEPAYPGGMKALTNFLERNLANPEAMAGGEEIKVKVKFVVGYDGVLKGFEIMQDGGMVFNNEVIRVLKKMPNWVPGKSNGKNVSVYHVIPVKFVQNE